MSSSCCSGTATTFLWRLIRQPPHLQTPLVWCLSIRVVQDILAELRDVDGGHHGEPEFQTVIQLLVKQPGSHPRAERRNSSHPIPSSAKRTSSIFFPKGTSLKDHMFPCFLPALQMIFLRFRKGLDRPISSLDTCSCSQRHQPGQHQ